MTAALEAQQPVTPVIRGFIDAVDGGQIFGWAWDSENPGERLVIEIWNGERMVATATADQPRPDLAAGGIGDGRHAFVLAVPEGVAENDVKAFVRISRTGELIPLERRPTASPADQAAALPMQRIAGMLNNLDVAQRHFNVAAHTVLKGLRSSIQQATANLKPQDLAVEEIKASQAALQKQIESLDVFITRLDATLRDLDGRFRQQERNAVDRPLRKAVGALVFILVVLSAAVAAAVVAHRKGLLVF